MGAEQINGLRMSESQSVGKHLFLRFDRPEGDPAWLHVHLGLYGSWRFYGSPGVDVPPSIGAPRQTFDGEDAGTDAFQMIRAAAQVGSDSNEGVRLAPDFGEESADGPWSPPAPRGAVRLRLVTDQAAADLTGPTQCEVLDAGQVEEILVRLGPDPLDLDSDANALRQAFVTRVRASRRPVGELVMDQSVAAGVGNIYRAEGLFRQGISPFRKGAAVSEKRLRNLWDDFVTLLRAGVEQGQIVTVEDKRVNATVAVEDPGARRWFVYKRAGQPCLVCGRPIKTTTMAGRNLFWCSTCQR